MPSFHGNLTLPSVGSRAKEITEAYLEECARDDTGLGTVVRRADYPRLYRQSYEHLLLDRPIFVDASRVARFAADLCVVFRLLVSLPERLFNGDLSSYAAAVGIDQSLARLMIRDATGNLPVFARSDAYDDGSDFKLLELNCGTQLGGIDFTEMNRALLHMPEFATFADRYRLEYVDTADVVAQILREVAAPLTSADPVVVLLETTGGIAAHPNYLSVQEAMRARGIDFHLGEVQEMKLRARKLNLRGKPVDIALRFYAAGEIVECPYGEDVLAPILRAHAVGSTILFTTLESGLFGTKGALALLSDERNRGLFSKDELGVIERVVPVTRVLQDGPCWVDGTRWSMLPYCERNREALVLKPCVGWGGAGTLVGRDVAALEWASVLKERANGRYVVQRTVSSVLEDVWNPDAHRVEAWRANWGVFVTDAGYSGSFVRTLRPRHGSVVAFANDGTKGSCVFACPSPEAHADGEPRGAEGQ